MSSMSESHSSNSSDFNIARTLHTSNYIDLTLDTDDDSASLSSVTERGSVDGDACEGFFDDDDYLDDDEYESLLQSWDDGVSTGELVTQDSASIYLSDCDGLYPNMAVELSCGHFMRIKEILIVFNGDIYLRGLYFKELTAMDTPFPQRDKELCWLIAEDIKGNVQLDREVPITSVVGVTKIVMTNRPWLDDAVVVPDGYICRLAWQKTAEKAEWIIRYLTFSEADVDARAPAHTIRENWRGQTIPFGTETVNMSNMSVSQRQRARTSLKFQRQYSFGDAFCGAGGVSVGAWKAGLRVKYGIDSDQDACETWRSNFVHSTCFHADLFSWLSLHDEDARVDISHSSPPCQPFSPAHTRSYNVQRDEENSSLIFSALNVIEKVRPRVHTIEETFGVPTRHKETYLRMIQDILERGYSIHTKTINCAKYGVPQLRRRLFIIAVGPGEKLPAFPAPTHGTEDGLPPYVTINDAIRNISRFADNHDPANTTFRDGKLRAPYNGDRLANTITCGGGEGNYHPSGQRPYTVRELACLQTFPILYRFPTAYAKKQVGNSVPPRLAEVIFRAAVKSLQETDEKELEEIEAVISVDA